ncbi:MAG: hypothetical protein QME79_12365 [Bacillota bacterium]|nr:hypothetical protein [Bacillota bacterium]
MRMRMKTRAAWSVAAIVAILAVWLAVFVAAVCRAENPAWDFEAGYQLAPEPAPYVSARVNLSLGELGPVGLWLLPEGGVVLGSPPDWYGRVQVLADLPWFTAGGEVRTGNVLVTRVFVRFGL